MDDAVRPVQLFAQVLAWSRVERCRWSWVGLTGRRERLPNVSDGPERYCPGAYGSLIYSPDAVIHSPAEMMAA